MTEKHMLQRPRDDCLHEKLYTAQLCSMQGIARGASVGGPEKGKVLIFCINLVAHTISAMSVT